MEGKTLLVVDVGSSVLKAVLFSPRGETLGWASEPIATRSGADRASEQDPNQWWAALGAAVRALPGASSASAIAFSGSMQNLIALDTDGRPVGPAILYSDRRLEDAEIERLAEALPGDYSRRTGNRLDPAHTVLKLMARDRFGLAGTNASTRWTFGAKDALTFRLTGESVIDPTTASTTGLMGIADLRWDDELLAIADVDKAALPHIRPADAVVGQVTRSAAEQTGLPAGIPVFNGSGDAGAATWGAGADAPGSAYCYLGTTGWVAATLDIGAAAPPRDIYTLADPVRPGRVVIISPFLTAGAAMDWLATSTGRPVGQLLDEASREDDRPGDTLFLPYLGGERAPFEDSKVRGAFLGLDRATTPGAMALAVLEGVAFAVRHNLEAANLPPSVLTVIGGAARHPLQRQILADALGRDVAAPDDGETMTAAGVLRMVAGAAGIEPDRAGASAVVRPRLDRAARHDARYAAYLSATSFVRDLGQVLAEPPPLM